MAVKFKFRISHILDEKINKLALDPNAADSELAGLSLAYIIGFHAGNLVNYVGLVSHPKFHAHTALSVVGIVFFKEVARAEDVISQKEYISKTNDEVGGIKFFKEDKNQHLFLVYCRDDETKMSKKMFDSKNNVFIDYTSSIQIIDDSKIYIHSSFVKIQACIKLNLYENQHILLSKDKLKEVFDQAKETFKANTKNQIHISLKGSNFSTNTVIGLKDATENLYDCLEPPKDSNQMGDYLPQLSKKEKLELVKKWYNKVKAQRDNFEFKVENELSVSDDDKMPQGFYKHNIEIYTYIHVRDSKTKSFELLLFNIRQHLLAMQEVLVSESNLESVAPDELKACSFKPAQINHLVSTVYAISDSLPNYKRLQQQRRALHIGFLLPLQAPIFRFTQRIRNLSLSSPDQDSGYLCNVHVNIAHQSGLKGGTHSLLNGTYTYHHYMQDRFNDNGWGCAYRSLQTIISWFKHQAYIYSPDVEQHKPAASVASKESNELRARLAKAQRVPSHEEIQRVLVDVGDKQESFIGSSKWIGSQEICFVLNHLYNIESKFISINSGGELSSKGRDLCAHFASQSTPVMIGGGMLAHTIIGCDFNDKNGDISYLILDPHYTGAEDLATIVKKGWCGWKKNAFWDKASFYNLCLPQRPITF